MQTDKILLKKNNNPYIFSVFAVFPSAVHHTSTSAVSNSKVSYAEEKGQPPCLKFILIILIL